MEDTIYHEDKGIQNYLNFLTSNENIISERGIELNEKLYYHKTKSMARSLQLELKGFDANDSEKLVDMKRLVVLENMYDPENLCDFERVFLYSGWVVLIKKDGAIEVQERQVDNILMGRVTPTSNESVLSLSLNSNLCSKLHCQVKLNDFFKRSKVGFGFYALLYLYEEKLSSSAAFQILRYLGRDDSPVNVNIVEMGSYLGVWLNLHSDTAEMAVGDYFHIDSLAYIKIESIFHKEFDQIVKEVDSRNMQKLTLTPANKPHYTTELLKLFKSQKGIHTNYGFLRVPDYEPCVKKMLDDNCKFSFVAISTNMEDKNFVENFLLLCLNDSRNVFDFDGLAVNFSNKKFSLEVRNVEIKRNVRNFWKSVSVKDNERFKYNEVAIGSDTCFMIQSAVFRLKYLQYA